MPYFRKETDLDKRSTLVERNRVINSLEAKLQRSTSHGISRGKHIRLRKGKVRKRERHRQEIKEG